MTPIDIAAHALAVVLGGYTVVAGGHFLLQLLYAHRTYRFQHSRAFDERYPPNALAVDVVVPVYNEAAADLDACTSSILAQRHRGLVRLIVVDDGSTNRAELLPVYERLRAQGATVILAPRNRGKRAAQYLAFAQLRGEIVATVDSDTRLEPDAIAKLTRQFANPAVGAITGDVGVTNAAANLLTRLIGLRYWMAFHQERAAQSWFRSVLCCSGPLSAYRRSIIEAVQHRYIGQMFRGEACTYGDDRHLTNLVLAAGSDTVFDGGARATTNAPETIRTYLRQQLRWNKSFYRELKWTLPYIRRRPWFMAFDLLVQTLLPLLLAIAALSAVAYGLTFSPWHLVQFGVVVTGIALIRSSYAVVRERRIEFYLFLLYGFVHASLLIPTRAFALLTLGDNRWGTR